MGMGRKTGAYMTRRILSGTLLVAVATALWSCGYSLAGRGSFLPTYIKAVGIPVFTNDTRVFDIEQILTQRVRSEFMGRGRYTILPETSGVDATLIGQITALSIAPSSFNAQQQATRYAATLTVRLEFKDLKADKVLWSNPGMVFREEYDVATAAAAGTDVTLFFGQNANALERLAGDFAKTVVSAIMEAF
jgi:hypothetical protein